MLHPTQTISKFLAVVAFGCLLAALAVRYGVSAPEDKPLKMTTVLPRDFEVRVNTLGVLDTARSRMVSSAIKGDRGKIIWLVEEGAQVKGGDELVRLDPTPFEERIQELEGEILSLKAAVEGERQKVEWQKNQVDREIRSGEYSLKVARLDLKKVVEGEGPLNLAQYQEEMRAAREESGRYAAYIKDLEKLKKKGFGNLTEIALAKDKFSELKDKYDSARSKYNSYKAHVLPSLIETAKSQVERAEIELEQTHKGGTYKIAQAHAALGEVVGKLESKKSALARAREEVEKTVIRAPCAGIAILFETFRDGEKRKPRIGDKVWQNQPLLYLPDITSLIVKTQVREIDLHKVHLGQSCRVTIDAYPNAHFQGEVIFLGVMADNRLAASKGEKYFRVRVALEGQDDRMRPGMTARVSILSEALETSVLTVPIQAVFRNGGETFCYRQGLNGLDKVAVQLGRENEDLVEILSGLETGDKVSLVRPEGS